MKIIQEPSLATLKPNIDESVDFDATSNVYIEGENLEVLKLLQKSYFGKIKLIYIDPPYNTGKDFVYKDRFGQSLNSYLELTGQIDAEGRKLSTNTESDGRYHSNWLNMMYPRLYFARNLLRDDGVIFMSIDDHEVANLRCICDQIFGEENFLGCLIWKRRVSSSLADNNLSNDHEYVLSYKKSTFNGFIGHIKDYKKYKNPDNDPRGDWILDNLTVGMTASQRPNQAYNLVDPKTGKEYIYNPNRVWAYIPESMSKLIEEGRIIFPDTCDKRPMLKRYRNELNNTHNPFSSFMADKIGLNTEGTKVLQDLFGIKLFDYSKPISLLLNLVQQVCWDKQDIILDFFSGSATTAHAVMQLNAEDGGNRKYIMVQLPEPTPENSEARKAGYWTIAEIGKERIRRVAHKIKQEHPENKVLDLGFKAFKLDKSNFNIWDSSPSTDLQQQLEWHTNPIDPKSSSEDILYELFLKSGLELTVPIQKVAIKDKTVFSINDARDDPRILICLEEHVTEELVEAMALMKPRKVIFLDSGFNGNDQLKINAAETFKILSQNQRDETVFMTISGDSMQFKFSDSLDHQKVAIDAVVRLFEGQQKSNTNFALKTSSAQGQLMTELGCCNNLTLTDEELFNNTQKIQSDNNIKNKPYGIKCKSRDFSIEMETGTGKTYVYLRSIFELSKQYEFKKFIIVVPTIAIRAGVIKSIEIMKNHFNELYDNEPYNYFDYDSKKLGQLMEFARSNTIQIMIINIQSFNKSDNIIQSMSDRMYGDKPITLIQNTCPIVIIDEPQSVDSTQKGEEAIKKLNPLVTLRYSATHKNAYNLLYKLDPVSAYNQGLVKQIEVLSVQSEYHHDAYIKLIKIENTSSIRAYVEIFMDYKDEARKKSLWIKKGDDLFDKSKKLEAYQNGFTVSNIDCSTNNGYVEFSGGYKITMNSESNLMLKDEVMKAQVKATIEQHLKKESAILMQPTKIKVLSLFFIDKVSNYRIYGTDGTTSLGKIGKWFEDAYKELTDTQYPEFKVKDIEKIHNGYFSIDRRKHLKDSSGNTKDDEDAYSLIMRDKERLLDTNEPLRFIFSHSALKEGWDNPNVFQICTLSESSSIEKRRQVIGRGLRLAVSSNGERIHDNNKINLLTVIANESYDQFAKELQKQYEEDGVGFDSALIKDAKKKETITYNDKLLNCHEFGILWEKIKYKTKYRVVLNTHDLINEAIQTINLITIEPPKIYMQRNRLKLDKKKGVECVQQSESEYDIKVSQHLPDILTHLQSKTGLTRETIAKILIKSKRLKDYTINPDRYIRLVTEKICEAKNKQILNSLEYVKINDQWWEASQLKDETILELGMGLNNLYEVKHLEKTLFSHVACDSKIEEKFAEDLDAREHVKLFLKLPSWFKIYTPLGTYNPDWAFVYEKDTKLCLVAETKGSIDQEDLRGRELKNIEFGKKHFDALGVKFECCSDLSSYLKSVK